MPKKFTNNRPNYSYTVEGDTVWIVEDIVIGRVRLHDDPATVLEEITSDEGDLSRHRFIYRAREGQWDELIVSQGKFVRIAPLGWTDDEVEVFNA